MKILPKNKLTPKVGPGMELEEVSFNMGKSNMTPEILSFWG